MLEGLYSAAAGMTAQQRRLDAVANDISNVNTTGYKHLRVGFRDLPQQSGFVRLRKYPYFGDRTDQSHRFRID